MVTRQDFEIADIIQAYINIFNSADGRRVLLDLAQSGMVDATTFDPDPYKSAYNQGKRDLVLLVFANLQQDPIQFLANTLNIEEF